MRRLIGPVELLVHSNGGHDLVDLVLGVLRVHAGAFADLRVLGANSDGTCRRTMRFDLTMMVLRRPGYRRIVYHKTMARREDR